MTLEEKIFQLKALQASQDNFFGLFMELREKEKNFSDSLILEFEHEVKKQLTSDEISFVYNNLKSFELKFETRPSNQFEKNSRYIAPVYLLLLQSRLYVTPTTFLEKLPEIIKEIKFRYKKFQETQEKLTRERKQKSPTDTIKELTNTRHIVTQRLFNTVLEILEPYIGKVLPEEIKDIISSVVVFDTDNTFTEVSGELLSTSLNKTIVVEMYSDNIVRNVFQTV